MLVFHEEALRRYGGMPGVRDAGLLDSAVHRPFTIIGGALAYASGLEQAAALLQSLVLNHPFLDGNKRTAFTATLYFLQRCGYWSDVIFLSQRELERAERVILTVADEQALLAHGVLSRPLDVSAIAGELDRALRSSRRRKLRVSRLRGGRFYFLGGARGRGR